VLELVLSLLLILAGCALLYVGGDMLVSASTFIADRIGMSPIAIGATVVAIGTSAPEFSVSLDAALSGHSDISVGNVVGSNVCNIILVLGLCGLFHRLRTSREIYRIDFPILIAVSALFTWMIRDFEISRTEGIFCMLLLVAYVVWNLQRAAGDIEVGELLSDEVAEAVGENQTHWIGPVARAVGGIICLGLGAKWLVDGALQTLEPFAMSEAAIGITVVALGTSVPEIGTSIIAAQKGHGDLAVGNAIGSSVFNILGVLGFTASIRPLAAADVDLLDGAILIASSLAGLVLVARPGGIGRLQGGLLVATYSLYVTTTILGSGITHPEDPAEQRDPGILEPGVLRTSGFPVPEMGLDLDRAAFSVDLEIGIDEIVQRATLVFESESQIPTRGKFQTVGRMRSVEEFAPLRMLEGLGGVDRNPADFGKPELDPAVIAVDRSFAAIHGNRKAHLKTRGNSFCSRQRDEERVKVGAVSVALAARPERVAVSPTGPDLLVLDVVDDPVVDRPSATGRIGTLRTRANLFKDRNQNRMTDDDAFVRSQKSLRALLAARLISRTNDRALDLVAHDNRRRPRAFARQLGAPEAIAVDRFVLESALELRFDREVENPLSRRVRRDRQEDLDRAVGFDPSGYLDCVLEGKSSNFVPGEGSRESDAVLALLRRPD